MIREKDLISVKPSDTIPVVPCLSRVYHQAVDPFLFTLAPMSAVEDLRPGRGNQAKDVPAQDRAFVPRGSRGRAIRRPPRDQSRPSAELAGIFADESASKKDDDDEVGHHGNPKIDHHGHRWHLAYRGPKLEEIAKRNLAEYQRQTVQLFRQNQGMYEYAVTE